MIGLDIAKSVFQVHAVNEAGKPEIRRKLRRSELIAFFEKQRACTVVMEACGAAHHWARMLTGLGHNVKLIAPEAVKPFVKQGKKNDAADAAAICEAASRPDVKFVWDCPEIGGIMPPWQIPGLVWRARQTGGRIQNRAFRCRPRSEPGAADRRHIGTIASVATCSFSD